MKFLVDLALSPRTVESLRNCGYEAVRVNELGMAKSKDSEILEYAAKNDIHDSDNSRFVFRRYFSFHGSQENKLLTRINTDR